MTDVDFVVGLPKAELHVHLEGTLEPEMIFELAARNGIALPYGTAQDVVAAYVFDDLPSFLAMYYRGMNVLRTEQDFFDLTIAYLRRARSENIVYAEMFFDPQAHTERGVPFDTVISGIRRAQQHARAELGIETALILCFLRDLSAESAMKTLEAALPYRDWLLGVGLDSDEKNNPPLKFAEVFARARDAGFRLTMHCDVNQEDSVQHIRDCVETIGVDRIDHGVNSLEDEALCALLRDKGLGLTVCPVSNLIVVQSLTHREIRTMLQRGMKATINSDDPAYFRAYLNDNLLALQRDGGFSRDEILTLVRNAFDVSWIGPEQRAAYQARIDEYVAAAAA